MAFHKPRLTLWLIITTGSDIIRQTTGRGVVPQTTGSGVYLVEHFQGDGVHQVVHDDSEHGALGQGAPHVAHHLPVQGVHGLQGCLGALGGQTDTIDQIRLDRCEDGSHPGGWRVCSYISLGLNSPFMTLSAWHANDPIDYVYIRFRSNLRSIFLSRR